MKLLYFTGTGNSYDVSCRLGGEMIDVATATVTEIKDDVIGIVFPVIKDDVIGIVFPVYCNDLPLIMTKFLTEINLSADYIFAVATAGAAPGNSFKHIQYLLERKGLRLSYAHTVVMPDSCIIFKTEAEKQRRLMDAVDKEVETVLTAVKERNVITIAGKRCPTLMTKIMWGYMRRVAGIKNKVSDTQTCIQCKKCLSCPVGNITLENDRIQFGDRCEDCFRCIQICPTNAIRFGRVKRTEASRYINHNFLTKYASATEEKK